MDYRQRWNSRPVIFGEFDIRQGRAVRAAFAEDGETGSYACLQLSLRYADDNELVFRSVDEIFSQPFKLQQRLLWLAGEAARANGLVDVEDEPSGETGEGEYTNGHDRPSP